MPTRITQIEGPRCETSALKGNGENAEQRDGPGSESRARDAAIVPTVFKVEGTLLKSQWVASSGQVLANQICTTLAILVSNPQRARRLWNLGSERKLSQSAPILINGIISDLSAKAFSSH